VFSTLELSLWILFLNDEFLSFLFLTGERKREREKERRDYNFS